MNRTEAYRKIAFENGNAGQNPEERAYLRCRASMDCAATYEENIDLRRAQIECGILDRAALEVNDLELLAGRYSRRFTLPPDGAACIRQYENWPGFVPPSATNHRVVDYEKILHGGIRSVLAELDNRLSSAETPETASFCRAGRSVLLAVCRLAERYRALLLDEASSAPTETRKKELLLMADNFSKAPMEPCTHFYEALQCVWFLEFCILLLGDCSLSGRPDNWLYPFYRRDTESGVLTKAFARELIEQFYFKHNECYGSWPASLMVAGCGRDGKHVLNELSYLCVDAIRTVKLVNPSVAVSYTDDLPDDFLDRCVDCIAEGDTRPSLFNDRIVQKGLLRAGVSPEDARYYVHSTCVEITPIAASHIMVATPYVNLMRAFEYLLNRDGARCVYGPLSDMGPGYGGDTEEIHLAHPVKVELDALQTFDDFYSLLLKITAEIVRAHAEGACEFCLHNAEKNASPLVSSLLNDCIARGRDCGRGGARYCFFYPCMIGFSNFVDSVTAIKKAVYEDKIVTLQELAVQCRDDFPDKRLQAFLKNRVPKFGNGEEESDRLAAGLFAFLKKELEGYKTVTGGRFFPSYFAYVYHGRMGKQTAATPDGRNAHTALSEHLGAVRGMDKNGPLGVVDSISKIDQADAIGGVATNFRFTGDFASSPEGKIALRSFIRYFMAKDCFEMQFNVVRQEELRDAREHPENYRTLLVRVAGYSDYFVNLDPVIQNEIMERTEHGSL